jgi:hypothetical protein
MLVISIMVLVRPGDHNLTPLYHDAVKHWWHRQPLYEGPTGMNYLPQFVVLFGPFHLPPQAVADVLWRGTAALGLAVGVLLFCRDFPRAGRARAFFFVSLLTMPLCLQALQFGQANAHLAAALLLAAWCLRAQRWWAATALLWLATAIKPLGIAALGLAWAVYPHLWWRLILGLPLLGILPFMFGPPGYVWSQYLACAENLRQCSVVTERRFADLNGLLHLFGTTLGGRASSVVRAVAGMSLMLLCWHGARRQAEPLRALIWLGAAASFLMLFNPMTEANSYVILSPVLGLLAWWHLSAGTRWLGWLLAAMVLSMGLLPEPLRPWFGNDFSLAWYPPMALGFLAVLAWMAFQNGGSQRDLPVLGAPASRPRVP